MVKEFVDYNDPRPYYNMPHYPIGTIIRTDLLSPKEYGQKLLNRKRGRK